MPSSAPSKPWLNGLALGLVTGIAVTLAASVLWFGTACAPGHPCDAQASEWNTALSGWITALTGVAIAEFTLWTVILLRQAVDHETQILEQAHIQTTLARQTHNDDRADRRPWVSIQSVEITRMALLPGQIDPNFALDLLVSGRITLTNSGPRPAVGLAIAQHLYGNRGSMNPELESRPANLRNDYTNLHPLATLTVAPAGTLEMDSVCFVDVNPDIDPLSVSTQLWIMVIYQQANSDQQLETSMVYDLGQWRDQNGHFNHFVQFTSTDTAGTFQALDAFAKPSDSGIMT